MVPPGGTPSRRMGSPGDKGRRKVVALTPLGRVERFEVFLKAATRSRASLTVLVTSRTRFSPFALWTTTDGPGPEVGAYLLFIVVADMVLPSPML